MTEPLVIELEVSPNNITIETDPPAVYIDSDPDAKVIMATSPGRRGQPGPPGAGIQIFGETLTGANGVVTTFTLDNPYIPGSTAVYLNGLREFAGEGYTESGADTIAFSEPPYSSDNVRIDYVVQQ